LIPQYFIVAIMLSVAILPQFYLQIVANILFGLSKTTIIPQPTEFVNYISITQRITMYSFLFIGVFVVFWGLRALALRGKSESIEPTWGCGYTASTSKLQYTGKSFSKSLSKMFNSIVIERKQYEELKAGEIFPKNKIYTSHYHDFFELRVIRFITNRLIYSANYFTFIQNGRIQSYVAYGIVFIITILILTVYNLLS